ncbi:hypothetical protein C8Q76DRAFT_29473 [Earliella scabrosa]|nr:hypothetical protein C8Q76DRAFT_29473 [Earliella scabrosa]
MRSLVDPQLYKATNASLTGAPLTCSPYLLHVLHMADIEFVIEAPQVTRTNKKRPRLVTSCDHCRVKKIKCVQQPATGKCEACQAANLPCLYRDREQYFAERTRMLSGAGSALRDASCNAQSRAHLSAINASTPTPSRGPTPPQSSHASGSASTTPDRSTPPSFSSYLGVSMSSAEVQSNSSWSYGYNAGPVHPTWDGPVDPVSWTPRRSPDMNAHIQTGMGIPPPSPQASLYVGLFNTAESTQPHPNLMVNFIHVFFDRLGSTYPFLSYEVIFERFLNHGLPNLLANAIAASAARFSTLPEIVQIGPANAADVYCQMAKSLVPPANTPASIDSLHAVMLLAWAEHKRGRHAMFSAYAQIVMRIAAELGISEDSLPHLSRMSGAHGARTLQTTWQCIQQLERTVLASELVALTAPSPHSHNPAHHLGHQPHHPTHPMQAAGGLADGHPGVPSLW